MTPNAPIQSQYTYDNVNRLLERSDYDNGTGQYEPVYTYTYDAVGNRTTAKKKGETNPTPHTYNDDNQLLTQGVTTFTHDVLGNRTAQTGATMIYDFNNLLKSRTVNGATSTYDYDPLGNRQKMVAEGTTYRFTNSTVSGLSQPLVTTKTIGATTTERYSLYGLSLISQGGTAAADRQYPMSDGLGNIRFMTNASGTTVSYAPKYDPFGRQMPVYRQPYLTGPSFQGEYRDPGSSGLMYLRARYYDPNTGTFLSQGPMAGTLNNPQSQNGYNYANANPINYSDPSGEFPILAGLVVALVWAAVNTGWDIANVVYDACVSHNEDDLAFDMMMLTNPMLPGGAGGYKAAKNIKTLPKAIRYGATPEGRAYTKHYSLDHPERTKVPGMVIDGIIKNNKGIHSGGNTVYYDKANNLTVITRHDGSIESVHPGLPSGQTRDLFR